jgi:hypothetical protein
MNNENAIKLEYLKNYCSIDVSRSEQLPGDSQVRPNM